MQLGRDVEIIDAFFFDPSHCYLISIGDHCTICPNVRLIAHDASTKRHLGYTKIGRIQIGDHCFLGDSSIVLPNVTIGSHSIVAAGAIVTKDVPPRSVVAGNPARIISSVDDYLKKMRDLSQDKKIFDEKYFIGNLDDEKRKEILRAVQHGLGFMI